MTTTSIARTKRSAGEAVDDAISPSSQFEELNNQDSATVHVKLLLHTVDGVVPFLTPHLFRTCFPPPSPQAGDPAASGSLTKYVCLGVAARDTCVVPMYGPVSTTKPPPTEGEEDDQNEVVKDDGKKPRGYTLAATRLDPWLQKDYASVLPLVVVPSFDLLEDVAERNQSAAKPKTPDVVSVTNQHVLLWTPNGRLKVTPELYAEATKGFFDNTTNDNEPDATRGAIVPLYDMVPPVVSSLNRTNSAVVKQPTSLPKRIQTAQRRNEEWLRQFLQVQRPEQPQTSNNAAVWAPLVVHEQQDETNLIQHLQRLQTLIGASNRNLPTMRISGMAVVGWQYITSSAKRRSILRTVMEQMRPTNTADKNDDDEQPIKANSDATRNVSLSFRHPTSLSINILSARSLRQVLDAAVSGCQVIGTNLPTLWARSKKAFVCDIVSWRQIRSHPETALPPEKKTRQEEQKDEQATRKRLDVLDQDGCIDLNPPDDEGDLDKSKSTQNNTQDHHDKEEMDTEARTGVSNHPWFRDASPLVKSCPCLTCRTHSRAYVYHLVCAKELLAEILLQIHNLHHMMELFQEINHAGAVSSPTDGSSSNNNALFEFCNFIEAQLPPPC